MGGLLWFAWFSLSLSMFVFVVGVGVFVLPKFGTLARSFSLRCYRRGPFCSPFMFGQAAQESQHQRAPVRERQGTQILSLLLLCGLKFTKSPRGGLVSLATGAAKCAPSPWPALPALLTEALCGANQWRDQDDTALVVMSVYHNGSLGYSAPVERAVAAREASRYNHAIENSDQ